MVKRTSKTPLKRRLFLIEVDRQTTKKALDALATELMSVVNEVSLAVQDWRAMSDKLDSIIKEFPSRPSPASDEQKAQTAKFLAWLNDHNYHYGLSLIQR
ncbi:NAD-glutamate dehydrogenase [Paraglaciecola sp. Hal342]